ncbi:glycoside hydrolase family 128 protein [Xylaria nigripes]|nr:glycoside hydrolase family 128 protein [Xylaria nigripes]
MYTKAGLMALCAAATVKEVVGAHVHQHMHAHKREVVWAATETVVVTEYTTITVTEDQENTAAAVPTSARGPRPEILSAAPIITSESSTSNVVEPTTSIATPTITPTTLATNVKPTTSSSTDSPIVPSLPLELTTLVVTTSSEPVTTTSSEPVTTTSSEPVTTTSSEPVTTTSSEPVTTTSSEPVTTTSSEPVVVATPPVPAAAPKPEIVTNGSIKRGLAFNDATLVQEFLNLGGKASWAYNWAPSSAALPAGVTYYPMLWSPAPEHSNGWAQFAQDAISKGADALLGFNEPDIASQANMSPQYAAAAHTQWLNQYAGQVRISSPAISSSENANQGIDWLRQFFGACNGQCHVDFCVAHWYGPGGASGAQLFLNHLKDVSNACSGKPVWVTEFAAQSDDINAFMTTVVTALESSEFSFVEKYSYFMAGVGELFSSPTSLSSYGQIYATL